MTAIGGLALDLNLNFKSGLEVQVFSGTTLVGVSPVTAPDGFYFVAVPAGGPYTVKLFNFTTSTVVKTVSVSIIGTKE